MFVAMNRFNVAPGKTPTSRRSGASETHLQGVPGFLQFALLRSDNQGEYISHSTWRDRQSFIDWTQSEAFTAGHRQGSLMGILQGPPQIGLYEAVIVETPAPPM